ncbi:MAG: NUDIX domain-containing protein [Candidatus Chisholmbacteria bacterium]|nr:NUDIX domain-containing protein [Candidatus Chisholmbacteria bacterium]
MNKNQAFKREFSAGGAVYRKQQMAHSKWQIDWLIAKHSGYKKWTLPKGLIDPGETAETTAVREVAEETGITARIVAKIKPAEKYTYTFNGQRIFKVVQYFLMEYVSGEVADHDWEMKEVEWVSFEKAHERLAFTGQKKILDQAQAMLEEKR